MSPNTARSEGNIAKGALEVGASLSEAMRRAEEPSEMWKKLAWMLF